MSKVTNFYSGEGVDAAGRRIDEIWNWDDEQLEDVHDYIQWLFPTPTQSAFNSNAPVLTEADIETFRGSQPLKDRLRKSFLRFLRFLGLTLTEDAHVAEASNFEERRLDVWEFENHNWLRITRVLMSLRMLGLENEARTFFAWLESAYRNGTVGSGDTESRTQAAISFRHWSEQASAIN